MTTVDDERMRASDADRQRVAERLRMAMDEGRLTLGEYDERVAAAYAAQTYADFKPLLADLPAPADPKRQQVAPMPLPLTPQEEAAAREAKKRRKQRDRDRRSIRKMWTGWAAWSVFLTGIWFLGSLPGIVDEGLAEASFFWPVWPIGGVGIFMLMRVISHLGNRHDG